MTTRRAEKERRRDERLREERAAATAAARRRLIGGLAAALLVTGVVVAVLLAFRGGEERASSSSPERIVDVHGVGIDPRDGTVYIATHTGLFRSRRGEASARRVDGPVQDLMGFSVAAQDRFLASGHPGPGQSLPPNLGLIESRDRGRTWRSVSLRGESDMHVLRAVNDVVYAYDGRLRVSRDGGRTWSERQAPAPAIDVAIDRRDPQRVLLSTEDGVQLSVDGGTTWRLTGLREPVLLAWASGSMVYAVNGDGRFSVSSDGGRGWRSSGSAGKQPAAVAAGPDGTLFLAGPDGAVTQSSDGGRSWRQRSRN